MIKLPTLNTGKPAPTQRGSSRDTVPAASATAAQGSQHKPPPAPTSSIPRPKETELHHQTSNISVAQDPGRNTERPIEVHIIAVPTYTLRVLKRHPDVHKNEYSRPLISYLFVPNIWMDKRNVEDAMVRDECYTFYYTDYSYLPYDAPPTIQQDNQFGWDKYPCRNHWCDRRACRNPWAPPEKGEIKGIVTPGFCCNSCVANYYDLNWKKDHGRECATMKKEGHTLSFPEQEAHERWPYTFWAQHDFYHNKHHKPHSALKRVPWKLCRKAFCSKLWWPRCEAFASFKPEDTCGYPARQTIGN